MTIEILRSLSKFKIIKGSFSMRLFLSSLCLAFLILTPLALAQIKDHDHAAMENMDVSSKDIYAPAMKKMHEDMMVEATGDADIDFVQGMIPHHQGAVDMAKIVLKEGKDPEIKKFAGEIIAAQEKEIAFMQDWLKTHGK